MLKCNTPSTTTITTARKERRGEKYLRNHVNILTKVLLFNRIHSLGFDADSLTRERKMKEVRNNNDQAEEKETVLQNVCYTLAGFRLKEENVRNSLE